MCLFCSENLSENLVSAETEDTLEALRDEFLTERQDISSDVLFLSRNTAVSNNTLENLTQDVTNSTEFCFFRKDLRVGSSCSILPKQIIFYVNFLTTYFFVNTDYNWQDAILQEDFFQELQDIFIDNLTTKKKH